MTATMEAKGAANNLKSNQSLSVRQKMMFGMFCWGVQSWHQAEMFKDKGFDRKYLDAKKALHTGLVAYGLGIVLFVLYLQL